MTSPTLRPESVLGRLAHQTAMKLIRDQLITTLTMWAVIEVMSVLLFTPWVDWRLLIVLLSVLPFGLLIDAQRESRHAVLPAGGLAV